MKERPFEDGKTNSPNARSERNHEETSTETHLGFTDSDEVAFEPAPRTSEDYAAIVEITDFYNAHFPHSPRTLEKQKEKYDRNDGSFSAFTLRHKEKLAGLLEIRRKDNGTLLETMLIDPAFQGKGFGKKLFAELLSVLGEGQTITLHFRDSKREKLEPFYRGLGFSILSAEGSYSNGDTKWKMERPSVEAAETH